MARTNKYTSLNFNDIYEKKIINPNNNSTTSRSPSSSSSSLTSTHKPYSLSASSRLTHGGGMLLLSRPSPKPQPQPQPQPSSSNSVTPPESESISLRPQGKTGGTQIFHDRDNHKLGSDLPSPKTNKFVPPHLRPGFVPKEVPSVPDFQKPRHRPASAHANYHGSPVRFPEDGRPKSGGGYDIDRRIRGPGPAHGAPAVQSDSFPRSGGSRPSSTGW